MKNLLFLILDHGDLVDSIFKELSLEGYNATVLEARSIKHLLEDEEHDDINFFHISHLEHRLTFPASTFCYFIVDDEKLDALKNCIREQTGAFKKIKGAMFSYPISDFEGSF